MPDVPFRLLKNSPPDVLIAQSGLVGNDFEFPTHKTLFTADSNTYTLAESADSIQVPMHWISPDGVDYTKIFTFYRDSYLVDIEMRVNNHSGRHWQGFQYGQFMATEQQTDRGRIPVLSSPAKLSGRRYIHAGKQVRQDRFQGNQER